jgi:hypothetical protein
MIDDDDVDETGDEEEDEDEAPKRTVKTKASDHRGKTPPAKASAKTAKPAKKAKPSRSEARQTRAEILRLKEQEARTRKAEAEAHSAGASDGKRSSVLRGVKRDRATGRVLEGTMSEEQYDKTPVIDEESAAALERERIADAMIERGETGYKVRDVLMGMPDPQRYAFVVKHHGAGVSVTVTRTSNPPAHVLTVPGISRRSLDDLKEQVKRTWDGHYAEYHWELRSTRQAAPHCQGDFSFDEDSDVILALEKKKILQDMELLELRQKRDAMMAPIVRQEQAQQQQQGQLSQVLEVAKALGVSSAASGSGDMSAITAIVDLVKLISTNQQPQVVQAQVNPMQDLAMDLLKAHLKRLTDPPPETVRRDEPVAAKWDEASQCWIVPGLPPIPRSAWAPGAGAATGAPSSATAQGFVEQIEQAQTTLTRARTALGVTDAAAPAAPTGPVDPEGPDDLGPFRAFRKKLPDGTVDYDTDFSMRNVFINLDKIGDHGRPLWNEAKKLVDGFVADNKRRAERASMAGTYDPELEKRKARAANWKEELALQDIHIAQKEREERLEQARAKREAEEMERAERAARYQPPDEDVLDEPPVHTVPEDDEDDDAGAAHTASANGNGVAHA